MDIKIKHLGKAYGEQQILKDFSCLFPGRENYLHQRKIRMWKDNIASSAPGTGKSGYR